MDLDRFSLALCVECLTWVIGDHPCEYHPERDVSRLESMVFKLNREAMIRTRAKR